MVGAASRAVTVAEKAPGCGWAMFQGTGKPHMEVIRYNQGVCLNRKPRPFCLYSAFLDHEF